MQGQHISPLWDLHNCCFDRQKQSHGPHSLWPAVYYAVIILRSQQDNATKTNMQDAQRVNCCFSKCLERVQISHQRVCDLIVENIDNKPRKWGVCTVKLKVLILFELPLKVEYVYKVHGLLISRDGVKLYT